MALQMEKRQDAWMLTKEYHTAPAAERKMLRSRNGIRRKKFTTRRNAPGGGRPFACPVVRDGVFEWFVSLRFAIDWEVHAGNNLQKRKKLLGRFPKSPVRWKVTQLQAEYVAAALINGERRLLKAINTDAHWFALFENEYGVSFKMANRRYEVARHVMHKRLEIMWTSNARIMYYIFLEKGYYPTIINFDQSPFYMNEVGAQNKATLAILGDKVPIVEGKAAAHKRWTACLSTVSCPELIRSKKQWPFAEAMFKGAPDGPVNQRLQDIHRTCGLPAWFSATTAERGSYRERERERERERCG